MYHVFARASPIFLTPGPLQTVLTEITFSSMAFSSQLSESLLPHFIVIVLGPLSPLIYNCVTLLSGESLYILMYHCLHPHTNISMYRLHSNIRANGAQQRQYVESHISQSYVATQTKCQCCHNLINICCRLCI